MSAVLAHSQVYIKVIEVRSLTHAKSDETNNLYVAVYVDGAKRDSLVTKKSGKSDTPKWYQELLFTVAEPSSRVELRVYKARTLRSDQLLGTAALHVNQLPTGIVESRWLKLDPVGELNVLVNVAPYDSPPPVFSQHLNLALPPLRIQLESNAYYPGQTVRGAVRWGISKRKEIRAFSLELDGSMYSSWTQRRMDDNEEYYYGVAEYYNMTMVLAGSLEKGAKLVALEPGEFVVPFEFVLPMDIPASTETLLANSYFVRAIIDPGFGFSKEARIPLRILPHPHMYPQGLLHTPASLQTRKDMAPGDVHCDVSGPFLMNTAETYQLTYEITNGSTQSISYLTVTLKTNKWHWGRLDGSGKWKAEKRSSELAWSFKDLPEFPLAPGSSCKGVICLDIPADLPFTLRSEYSPIFQIAHSLRVKAATKRYTIERLNGVTKLPVIVGPSEKQFEAMPPPPIELSGPSNVVLTAPATHPAIMKALVPPRTTNGKTVESIGTSFGPIATYPGATQVPLAGACTERFSEPRTWPSRRDFSANKSGWVPGMRPLWVTDQDGFSSHLLSSTSESHPLNNNGASTSADA